MEGCTPFLFYQKTPTIKSKKIRQKNQYSSWATMFFELTVFNSLHNKINKNILYKTF